MQMAGDVRQQVNGWLQQQKQVRVNSEWLGACIEWINEERGSPASLDEVKSTVYEQWLYSDMKESGESFLPSNLHSVQAQFVRGDFCLQVNSVLNVAASAYSQLQKVSGQELDEAEDISVHKQNKAGGMSQLLYLELTDGGQTIHAMEYHAAGPIISADTEPGAKVLLHGPLQCRLGVLLLTRGSVEVLGGSVEALQEDNSVARVLARALGNEALAGSPLTHTTTALQTHSAPTQHCPTASAQSTRNHPVAPPAASSQQSGGLFLPSQPTRSNVPCGGVPPPPAAASFLPPPGNQCRQPPSAKKSMPSLDNDDEFEDIDFGDFDDFDLAEEAFLDPTAQQPSPSPQSPLSCSPPVRPAPLAGSAPSVLSPVGSSTGLSPRGPRSRPVCKVEPLQSTPTQTIVLDDSPPLQKKPSPPQDKRVPGNLPTLTVAQFKTSFGKATSSAVKIKARCTGTLEKLTYEEDQWRLLVSVEDSTGNMAVYFSNEVLEEFIGFSASYFKNKMEPFKNTSKDVRAKGKQGFSQCQSTLSQLNCWMEVRIVPGLKQPQVYKVY